MCRHLLISIVLVFISSSACNPYEYKELSPAYFNVDQIELNSSNGQNLSHNIKDLWLFIDDGYAGTFPIPAHIPVLETGIHKISFYPGIRNYGILAKPEIYTLLNEYKTEVDLKSNSSISLIPKYTYKSNVINYLQENFESSSIFINDLDSFKSNTIIRSTINVREGKYSGYCVLNSAQHIMETSTNNIEITSSAKKSAYLELDFISDTNMQIGLISTTNNVPSLSYFLTLLPSTTWKRIYIPLYEVIQEHDGSSFQIAIKSELKPPSTSAYFFIDNIRLICLP